MTSLRPYAQRDVVLTGVKATPSGWPTASLDPGSGHRPKTRTGQQERSKPQKFRSPRR